MSILNKLTEGIVDRDLSKEGAALLTKWERTGLLEGIDNDRKRNSMARLLENQAKELLREASSMAGGDVEGFAAVAFPIVRRVFGGLIANDLVSVQPMSLPSGLIFFLDFTFESTRLGATAGDSLYGGDRVGMQITGGVSLTGAAADESFYNLNNGYSSPTASVTAALTAVASGTFGESDAQDKLVRFDPDFVSGTTRWAIGSIAISSLVSNNSELNLDNLVAISSSANAFHVRRLNALDGAGSVNLVFTANSGTPAALIAAATAFISYRTSNH